MLTELGDLHIQGSYLLHLQDECALVREQTRAEHRITLFKRYGDLSVVQQVDLNTKRKFPSLDNSTTMQPTSIMLGILPYVFQPTIDALFGRNIPFRLRWRMLLLQPLNIVTISIIKLKYIFSSPFSVTSIPNRHGTNLRTLVYLPKERKEGQLSPLHISFHAGAFIGGFPETQAHFSKLLPERTGAVVVAPHYRYAPKHIFPAGIDDAEDVVKYCLDNCERLWGADPNLVTVDGFSAGGNFALALCQDERIAKAVKASTSFYGVVCLYTTFRMADELMSWQLELRLTPWEKPRSEKLPKNDPMDVFLPLFDSYPGPVRADNMTNPRMSPILSDVDKLPERMLLVVPEMDILVHEQLTFVERVKKEIEEKRLDGRSCEALYLEDAFHGWLELPVLNKALNEKKDVAFEAAIKHLKETHRRYGWQRSE